MTTTNQLATILNTKKRALENYLGGRISVDKFIQTAVKIVSQNPDLLACHPEKLYLKIVEIAELGLSLAPSAGQVYLIAYKSNLSVVLGYRGLITLYERAGVIGVGAEVVYEGESFHYSPIDERVDHDITADRDTSREILGAYAWAYLGAHKIATYMTRGQIEKIRDEAKGFKFAKNREETIWAKNFGEMAKKTAIRRLSKRFPFNEGIEKIEDVERVEKVINSPSELLSPPVEIDQSSIESESSPPSS